uniref:Sugar phosphate transporter domain-containing protein n=1 Tax=Haptolina ericina TaxID=156174 RepID=A0A7S3B4Y5_9EUKA
MAEPEEAAAVAPPPDATCIEDEAVEECVLAEWPAGKLALPQSIVDKASLGFLFFAWFFLNVMYNVTNKKCQNAFPMPWTMTVVSLFVGIPWVCLLWASGIRKAPKINADGWKVLLPIGAAHALGHAGAVIALGAGAVSFAQTVKAAEPVFTCVLSYIVLGTVFKWQVYASLLPIIVGVSLASLKELSFTWKALYGALTSNIAFASRAVLSKATMDKPAGENMDAPNLYGVLTIIAFTLSLPFALYFEGAGFMEAWKASTAVVGAPWLIRQMALDGFYYYTYNEVAFIALNKVSPITHSIANTIKRVCIILTTVLIFGNKLTFLGTVGSTIAVLGTFSYSILKSKFK